MAFPRLLSVALVLSAAILAGCTQSSRDAQVAQQGSATGGTSTLSDKDVSDIKATIDRWINDFVTNKRDDLANIITADMVLAPANAAPLLGRDASMAYMKAYPTITKFTATKDEVVGRDDLAYVRGTYSIDVVLPDKTTAHDQGEFLEIHRKQADGTWPYSRLIWHSTEPVPAAASAKK